MRRIFEKKRFNQFLSVILVCCMVAGTIGMNAMFVKAEDVIYPAGVPTVATDGFNGEKNTATYTDIVEGGVQQGGKAIV